MPPPMTASSTPVFVPPVVARAPAPAPAAPTPAAPASSPVGPILSTARPIPTAPAPSPVDEVPVPPPATVSVHLPTPVSAPPPAPVSPPPAAIEAPAGKQTEIFVTLVGEGLNVLRRVRAEHMGRDYYRIVDEMPAGETWQFEPGQIVRCKKTKLSSGKGLVAFEEAPRAS